MTATSFPVSSIFSCWQQSTRHLWYEAAQNNTTCCAGKMSYPGLLLSLRIISSFSLFASFLVIFLYLTSYDLRKTTFHTIIACVCLCDFFTSIGLLVGFPEKDTFACWIQALLINIFPVSSVFWITLISFMLYMNVFRRDYVTELLSWKVHFVCWVLPVVLSFLPLTTNKFGPLNERNGMCFIDERGDSPAWGLTFWVVVSFYFWIWFAMALYIVLFIVLSLKVNEIYRLYEEETHSSGGIDLRSQVKATLNKFIWYPINIIMCWAPPTIYDIMSTERSSYKGHDDFDAATDIIPAFLGILNVVVFFSTNSLAREKLLKLIALYFPCFTCIKPRLSSSAASPSSESPLHQNLAERQLSNQETAKGLQMFESYSRESEMD
jgi:hypothetical protein